METANSFGHWVRRQRKARDLTQQALADQVGCSLAAIKKIEQDERRPSRQIAELLADVLGVPASQRKVFLEVARGVRPVDQLLVAHEPIGSSLPSGTVTFLFTDIESSTKLAQQHAEAMPALLVRHHEILHQSIKTHHGYVFQVVGDQFAAAFHSANNALNAALEAQHMLYNEAWSPVPIKVRMGIHTGAAQLQDASKAFPYSGYATIALTQRIMSAGYGGQILLSQTTRDLVWEQLPSDVTLLDMSEHHLKDFLYPIHLYQVTAPDLPDDFPPLKTLDSPRHNLPIQLTSFIGREKEIANVIRLLEKARLITLTGPGGTGKTRLSIQMANELLDRYPDGVWMVELAPILDPLLVPRTTAIAIGLHDEPHRPVIDMVCDYLREKHMLIILDNCEHLLDACAQMADKILHAAPKLRILASSREALGIAGEITYRVPSLVLPDIQHLPPADSLGQYEAVKLFVDRATSAIPTFTVTSENASSIAQICQRLDGIPLAIELAAGKIRALSVEQIAKRLDDRFRLLTGRSRTALERHQTLRATIDWSYNLLSAVEQILFRRLSIFVGGWTLEAAEAVCAGELLHSDAVLDLLEQLINKSLVLKEETQNENRYHMLETTRQYANEKLVESGESDSLCDRHSEYFLNLAETAEPHLRRAEQVEWLNQLNVEQENLRAALTWFLGKDFAASTLRLAGSLGRFWHYRNYWMEGTKWLQWALSRKWNIADEVEKGRRAKALLSIADLHLELDDYDEAGNSIEKSMAIYEDLSDEHGQAFARALLGYVFLFQGEFVRAQSLLEQSRVTFLYLKDTWGQAYAISGLAHTYRYTSNHKMYKNTLEEHLKLIRASGDRYLISTFLNAHANWLFYNNYISQAEDFENEAEQLLSELQGVTAVYRHVWTKARLAYIRGDHKRAKELCIKASMQYEMLGEKHMRALSLWLFGYVAMDDRDIDSALSNLENAWEIAHTILVKEGRAFLLAALAEAYYFHGDHADALDHFKQSLGLLGEVGEKTEMTFAALNHMASVAVSEQSETTVQLLGAADAFAQPIKPIDPIFQYHYDRIKEKAYAQLGEMAFSSAWARGQKMSIGEALDLAFKMVDEM